MARKHTELNIMVLLSIQKRQKPSTKNTVSHLGKMQLHAPNNVIVSDSIKMFFGYLSKFE